MGVVEKQSIKGSVIIYAGIILGFINTGLVFPKILSTEQIGLVNILISYSTILGQFGNLGFTNTIIKFFPYFKNKDKYHNGFLKIITLVSFVGFLISLLLFFSIKSFLVKTGTEKSILLFEYIYLLIPLTFFTIYFNAYDAYYRTLFNSVPGIFLREFSTRLLVLVFISLFYFNLIGFKQFVFFYILAYSFPAIGITISIFRFGEFKIGRKKIVVKKDLKKSMISVSLFSIISGFSGVVLINIDRIMLERYNGLSDVGIYSIAFFFGTLVGISARPISRIAGALIADFWKNKDLESISKIYKGTAINQFIIGVLVIIGIWSNIHNVFKILPIEYLAGKFVILIIGFAFLTDMLAGSSVNILAYSQYYRYHTYIMAIFIVVAVITNMILIPRYGITGAALATLISKIFYNTLRGIFLFVKFKLYPYNYKFIVVGLIGAITYFISTLMPIMENLYFDIIFRSLIILIIFMSLIYFLSISKELNNKLNNILSIK